LRACPGLRKLHGGCRRQRQVASADSESSRWWSKWWLIDNLDDDRDVPASVSIDQHESQQQLPILPKRSDNRPGEKGMRALGGDGVLPDLWARSAPTHGPLLKCSTRQANPWFPGNEVPSAARDRFKSSSSMYGGEGGKRTPAEPISGANGAPPLLQQDGAGLRWPFSSAAVASPPFRNPLAEETAVPAHRGRESQGGTLSSERSQERAGPAGRNRMWPTLGSGRPLGDFKSERISEADGGMDAFLGTSPPAQRSGRVTGTSSFRGSTPGGNSLAKRLYRCARRMRLTWRRILPSVGSLPRGDHRHSVTAANSDRQILLKRLVMESSEAVVKHM
jgi:hypothetical protein